VTPSPSAPFPGENGSVVAGAKGVSLENGSPSASGGYKALAFSRLSALFGSPGRGTRGSDGEDIDDGGGGGDGQCSDSAHTPSRPRVYTDATPDWSARYHKLDSDDDDDDDGDECDSDTNCETNSGGSASANVTTLAMIADAAAKQQQQQQQRWRQPSERGGGTGQVESATPTSGSGTAARIPEYLQLSLEEAFFLVYALGSLTIESADGVPMDTEQCWQAFRRAQPTFSSSYAVYHHLRSAGWVPKTGLKFGVEFLAYRRGPVFFHSSYSVMVRTVDAVTLQPVQPIQPVGPTDGDGNGANGNRDGEARPLRPEHRPEHPHQHHRGMRWSELSCVNRLSSQVAKELMICNVLVPPLMARTEWASPRCLAKLTVQHVLMRRWLPEKSRADPAKQAAQKSAQKAKVKGGC
jgi:tRNA splicing endonuclease